MSERVPTNSPRRQWLVLGGIFAWSAVRRFKLATLGPMEPRFSIEGEALTERIQNTLVYALGQKKMPHYKGELLSFESKYSSGGKSGKLAGGKMSAVGGAKGGAKMGISGAGMASLNRTIPAPISDELTAEAKRLALAAFQAIGGEGIARIDFLLDDRTGKLYFNEINTMPGSLAYYLWEASGVDFDQLVTRLVEGALKRTEARRATQFAMDVNLLHPARR